MNPYDPPKSRMVCSCEVCRHIKVLETKYRTSWEDMLFGWILGALVGAVGSSLCLSWAVKTYGPLRVLQFLIWLGGLGA